MPLGDPLGYEEVSPLNQIAHTETYLRIAPYIIPTEPYLLRLTLRHPDLNPLNIFVADDLTITSVINWEHCSVLPLVLQAGVPDYLQNFGDEQSLRLKLPILPDNVDKLSRAERASVMEQYRRTHLHYYYLVATYKHKIHYDALCLESTLETEACTTRGNATGG